MRVLILGSGGREHAFAWKVAQSRRVDAVFVAPGNAGTALEPRVTNVDIAADDLPGLIEFAKRERIDLTIVGPEGPLVLGVTDAFEAAGLSCFGPRKRAARLEGSKAYTKDFLSVTQFRPPRTQLSRGRISTRHGCARSARRWSSKQTGSLPARA